MLLSHSLLLPKEIFSTRAKGAGKLSLIIGSKNFLIIPKHIYLETLNIVMGYVYAIVSC